MGKLMEQMKEVFGEPISTYTRAEAIEDGVLVDVSEWARENGFKFPVAVTRRVWEELITPPGDSARANGQSEKGRARDIFMMLHLAIKRAGSRPTDKLFFEVLFDMGRVGYGGRPEKRRLVSVCGPGDNLEPVITVMMPDED